MKKILVENCKDCPFAVFDIVTNPNENTRRIESKTVYRCDHVDTMIFKWTDGKDIPNYCPLEDV